MDTCRFIRAGVQVPATTFIAIINLKTQSRLNQWQRATDRELEKQKATPKSGLLS
jgi:hypothetical protein